MFFAPVVQINWPCVYEVSFSGLSILFHFSSVPLIYLYVFASVLCCFIYYSLLVYFAVWNYTPSLPFSVRSALAILWSFMIPWEFSNICILSLKNATEILTGVLLNVEMFLGRMTTLIMLYLPICEQEYLPNFFFLNNFWNVPYLGPSPPLLGLVPVI